MHAVQRITAVAAMALAAVLIPALPAAAKTRTVKPGESIQAAIDKSSAGDTVSIKKGTYHEFLQLRTDRVTLKGHHAKLKPASTPGATLCDLIDGPTGICVVGAINPPVGEAPPVVTKQVSRDRITGLTISGFKNNGIFAFGANRLRVDHNSLSGNGEYGAFSNTSTRTRLDHNVVKNNTGEAGLYVGDSPSAHATVTRNRLKGNHGQGLFIRDASHGVASRNSISGSCIGILVLADAPGPAGHWKLSRNKVRANNQACAANPEEDSPAVSGIGIALLGANHVRVTRNVISHHKKKHDSPFTGGLIIRRANIVNGTEPAHIGVDHNVFLKNKPRDIDWDGIGSVSFAHNACTKGKPSSAC